MSISQKIPCVENKCLLVKSYERDMSFDIYSDLDLLLSSRSRQTTGVWKIIPNTVSRKINDTNVDHICTETLTFESWVKVRTNLCMKY